MSEEIKEVHIKTYDEWLKYYKNATKEQVIEDLTQDVKYFADAVKDIKDLQDKLQQKENIIKEVREYIESFNLPKDLGVLGEAPISISELKHILEILEDIVEKVD